MNGTVVSIVVLFLLMWGCVTCSSRQATRTQTDTTVNVMATAADGLDLKALGALVKNVSTAEELEKELNKPGGINNLDLNEDDQVDFITVTEYGNGQDEFGFSLTVEPAKGEVQEIATIEVIKEQEQAVVQVHGNQQIYGHGHHYSATHAIGGFLLMAYLLRPHPFWAPTYGWGYYPSYYSPHRTVTRTVYANNVRSVAQNSSMRNVSQTSMKNTGIQNPNQGKVANSGIKRSLANPTATQKQFQARNPSRAVKSGGFGRGGNTVRSKSSSRSFGGRGK